MTLFLRRVDQSSRLFSTSLKLAPSSGASRLFAPEAEFGPAGPRRAGTRRSLPAVAGLLIASDLGMMILALLISRVLAGEALRAGLVSDAVHAMELGWRAWLPTIQVVALLVCFHLQGHYTVSERLVGRHQFRRELSNVICTVMIASFIFALVSLAWIGPVGFDHGLVHTPQNLMLLPWLASVPLIMAGRVIGHAWLQRRAPSVWTVVIGDADVADPVIAAMESRGRSGYEVAETVSAARFVELAEAVGGRAVLGAIQASFAVVALGGSDPCAERRVVELLDRDGAHYAIAPNAHHFPTTDVTTQSFFGHDVMLLERSAGANGTFHRAAKTCFDAAAALALVAFLAPLFCLLWFLTRRDGGPALFRHRRVGANGVLFDCFKFRTMLIDADQRLASLLASDENAAAEWAATHKLKDDPRITPIGRFLRTTSLDELPQLFNVLRGEMSLVGPRPVVEAEMPRYAEDAAYYCKTRPGLTGLWQVSGRSDTSYAHRVRLDVWYVRNWSFWHDLAILLKTVPAVLLRRGAG